MLELMRRHGEGRQETHEELVHWFPVGILSRERYPSRWGMLHLSQKYDQINPRNHTNFVLFA
jgi:hypothetical protein